MKLYRLSFVIPAPSEDSGGKFVAEVPSLPGCRSWGDSGAKALENLQSVAAAFIESYRDHGDQLPPSVEEASSEAVEEVMSEVFVAV